MSSVAPAASPSFEPPVPLESLARDAWVLRQVPRNERSTILRPEGAAAVDRLLARVARGRGAIDVALAEGLAALSVGDRFLRLGYSCCGDYARERLGIALRTAQAMVHLGRELRTRPLLRRALRRGEVSMRRAQTVLRVAVGEAEAAWVQMASEATVRALEVAVRERLREVAAGRLDADPCARPGSGPPSEPPPRARGATSPEPPPQPHSRPHPQPPSDDEPWERVDFELSPEVRATLDEAMDLAGRLLGAAAPRWQRLEAIGQEYVGAHPEEAEETERDRRPLWPGGPPAAQPLGHPVPAWLEPLKEHLEKEMRLWWFLEKVEPVEAPRLDSLDGDGLAEGQGGEGAIARRIDADLRGLAALRERWDELVGHLGLHVRWLGLWKDMGFASFDHYCAERLGMSARAVRGRVWLERRLYDLPSLRQAMREGRVSYEMARILADTWDDELVKGRVAWAQGKTCIEVRRAAEAAEDRQMRARRVLRLRVPLRVDAILRAAFRAARKLAGHWLRPEECLLRMAEHFIETWKDLPGGRSTPERRAVERDRGLCQVPGCSRAAAHAHHVLYRARGGGDEPENLVALCAAHHLHGVHRGFVRVSGRAPDGLSWELGERISAG